MEKILVFGHKNPDTDTICSSLVKSILEMKKNNKEVIAARLGNVNKETQFVLDYLKIDAPVLIEKLEKDQEVILVDHNEFAQSADGIEEAEVIEVIDHHRIYGFQTAEPLYYTAKPYGCTCTILYNMFKEENIEIEKLEATLMASAIISDTLLLKSPTTTKKDVEALEALAKIANIDINTYGLDMLKAGTDLSSFSINEILNLDAKKVNIKGKNVIINQVNTASIPDVMEMKEKLEAGMNEIIETENLDLFLLLITDIVNSNSEAIVLGDRTELISKSYEIDDDIAVMPGVVSRKKQILPLIETNM